MRRSAVVATLVLIPLAGAATAHPHSYVDQQVQLSLGLEVVNITAIIVQVHAVDAPQGVSGAGAAPRADAARG